MNSSASYKEQPEPLNSKHVEDMAKWNLSIAKPFYVKAGRPSKLKAASNAANRAKKLAQFLLTIKDRKPIEFTWCEFHHWSAMQKIEHSKKKLTDVEQPPPLSDIGLPATNKNFYTSKHSSWSQNYPGSFHNFFRFCFDEQQPVIRPVGDSAKNADRFRAVLHDSNNWGKLKKIVVEGASKDGAEDNKIDCGKFTCQHIEDIMGEERDESWVFATIMFLDGAKSTSHHGHRGPKNAWSPSVIKAAQEKIEKEIVGYRIVEHGRIPIGYVSLWRVLQKNGNDLYHWVSGTGTMPLGKEQLGRIEGSITPKIEIAYISSITLHPYYRVSDEELQSSGDRAQQRADVRNRARISLLRGVIGMLEEYADANYLFTELVAWVSYQEDYEFIVNELGGEQIANHLVRLPLWPRHKKTHALLEKLMQKYEKLCPSFVDPDAPEIEIITKQVPHS